MHYSQQHPHEQHQHGIYSQALCDTSAQAQVVVINACAPDCK